MIVKLQRKSKSLISCFLWVKVRSFFGDKESLIWIHRFLDRPNESVHFRPVLCRPSPQRGSVAPRELGRRSSAKPWPITSLVRPIPCALEKFKLLPFLCRF